MFRRLAKFGVFALCASAIHVHADRADWIRTTQQDPHAMCTALEQSFPKTLRELRALGPVKRESIESARDYCEPEDTCEVQNFELPGLNVSLLVTKSTKALGVLTLSVTESKWRFFRDVKLGQSITSVGKRFGVQLMPSMPSPIRLVGECAGLVLDHNKGRVSGVSLDCQACW